MSTKLFPEGAGLRCVYRPPLLRVRLPPPPLIFLNSLEDVVIILIGLTGSGKSSFISLYLDRKLEIGYELESYKYK